MIRLLHIIASLDTGGAETALINLIRGTSQDVNPDTNHDDTSRSDHTYIQHTVLTFSRPHERATTLQDMNVNIKQIRFYNFPFLILSYKPQIIMGWLLHGTLATLIAKFFSPKSLIIWNIRYSHLPNAKLKTRLGLYLLKIFSKTPLLIIYNSHAGKNYHEEYLKYSSQSSTVISNGFNTNSFRPDSLSRKKFLATHKLHSNSFIFGMVARFDPYKNHANFILAALEWLESLDDSSKPVYFIFIGKGMDSNNQQLKDLVRDHSCAKKIIFLGEKLDVNTYYQAMNIHCLYSTTEGFPNAVGESMSCEVPNIATDVGDVSQLVNPDHGWLIPLNDKEALINSLNEAFNISTEELEKKSRLARQHILNHFSQESANKKYLHVFEKNLNP